jgi:2-octaprenyl-6-methoxyphenol hydroxylase
MVGASLALAVAPLGLRVAVVEPVARDASAQPSFDDRTTALSRSSQRMFQAMGLWDDIVAAATPITRIHVSDQGRFGFSRIDADEQQVEALGYVVINRVLGSVIQAALAAIDGPEMLCPARITAAEAGRDQVRLTVEAGGRARQLGGKLLVVADGANSTVREMVGITAEQVAYGQRAVIGNLLTERPLDNCAYERFTERGPLAMLPMTEGRAGFVWTVSEHDAERVLALEDAAFLAELQEQFGNRLGALSRVGARAAYPLVLSKALRLTAQRTVLVGNAAHGLHPVAAQGFNLGLRDVAALCDCISDAIAAGGGVADVGDARLLQRYAQWRRSDQKKLVGFTDGLVRLFGASARPLRVLRSLGMLGFDLVPGVRSFFARHTMGLAGRLPRLSRGVPLT